MAKNGTPVKTDIALREGSTALSIEMLDEIYGGLTIAQSQTLLPGGDPLIKLDKASGEWNLGINNESIQEGSAWMVDPLSIVHGWICWDSNTATKLGEVMTPMYDQKQPKPAQPAPINGFPFKEQRGFIAVCRDGDNEGTTGVYRASSVGAIKGIDPLVTAIRVQIGKCKEAGAKSRDDLYVYPVIQFGSYDYKHSNPSYGKIWNPTFTVVAWANSQGHERPVKAPAGAAAQHPPKPEPKAGRKGPTRDRSARTA